MWENYCVQNRAINDMNYKTSKCKDCLPDCNRVQMDWSTRYSTSANYADICEDESEIGIKYVKKLLGHIDFDNLSNAMAENGLQNVYDVNISDTISVCKFLSKHEWSFAMVELNKLTGIRIMQDVRTSFADRLATIGKVLCF